MKVISLNTWGGRIQKPLIDFVKRHRDVDIFCFQEMLDNAQEIMGEEYPDDMYNQFSDLQALLPEHKGFFRPVLKGVYGLAMLVKKDIEVTEEGEMLIHKSSSDLITDGHHSRNMQWVRFVSKGTDFVVVNVHGLWNGKGKDDTPERIAQSKLIKEFLDRSRGVKILCGDFNLNPETESIELLEKGMRNLVKEYGITSTRTSLYTKPGKFADYAFVSEDLNVKDFRVLPDEVSDHAPLLLEVE